MNKGIRVWTTRAVIAALCGFFAVAETAGSSDRAAD